MRTEFWKPTLVMIALALASTTIPNASAQCGLPGKLLKPTSWNSLHASPRLLHTAFEKDDDEDGGPSIVGMWHVVFTAQTMNGSRIDNTMIDNAVVVWHKDGTEVMNSNRPAQDGNICLGVWTKTGRLKYYLNHIPWGGNDVANEPNGKGNPLIGTQITEQITLHSGGDRYSGTFSLTAYGLDGKPDVAFTGVLTATRITPNTPITSLF